MRDWDAEIRALKRLCASTDSWTEGGKPVVFLSGLNIVIGGKTVARDALLWPHEREGYPSRLFLSERVETPNLNWNHSFGLQGHEWHACSWQGVSNDQPLVGILAGHLKAFQ